MKRCINFNFFLSFIASFSNLSKDNYSIERQHSILNYTQSLYMVRSKPLSGLHLGPTPSPLAIFNKQYSFIALLKILEGGVSSVNAKHLTDDCVYLGGKKIEVVGLEMLCR